LIARQINARSALIILSPAVPARSKSRARFAQVERWYIDNWSIWLDLRILLRTPRISGYPTPSVKLKRRAIENAFGRESPMALDYAGAVNAEIKDLFEGHKLTLSTGLLQR
jgi:hypothetical protein